MTPGVVVIIDPEALLPVVQLDYAFNVLITGAPAQFLYDRIAYRRRTGGLGPAALFQRPIENLLLEEHYYFIFVH